MGNTLGIYRRTRQEDESGTVKTSGVRVDYLKSPKPSPADASQWKTPENLGPNLLKSQITALIDPRSPNEDISRTPIMIVGEETDLKRKMNNRFLKVNQAMNQMSLDGGSEFNTPVGNVEATSPAFDPRSPTYEFNRTPVVAIPKKDAFRIKPSKFEVNNHSQEN